MRTMDHPRPHLPKRFHKSEAFFGPQGGSAIRPREFQQLFGLLLLLGLMLVFSMIFIDRGTRTLDKVFKSTQPAAAQSAPASQPDGLADRIAAQRRLDEQRAERLRILPTLYQGAFMDAGNGDDFKETPGYRELIRVLKDHAPSTALGKAEALMDYRAVIDDPDRFRGDVVRFRGVAVQVIAQKLESSLWGLTDIYRGFVMENDGSECVVFDCPDRPPDVRLRRDLVEVEGIFYRTVRYEDQKGRQREIPYILAKTVKVLTLDDPNASSPFGNGLRKILLVLALALIVGGMIGYRFRRPARRTPPAPAGFREMFERKFEEERRKAQKPPPPPT